jgi:hypothetical protein
MVSDAPSSGGRLLKASIRSERPDKAYPKRGRHAAITWRSRHARCVYAVVGDLHLPGLHAVGGQEIPREAGGGYDAIQGFELLPDVAGSLLDGPDLAQRTGVAGERCS